MSGSAIPVAEAGQGASGQSWLRPSLVIHDNPIAATGGVASVEDVLTRKPQWVTRQINSREALALAGEISATGATSAIELGVASGFSSAVLFAALAKVTPALRLLAFDRSARFYADSSRATGAAFAEIHGALPAFRLTTGIDSGMIKAAPQVDFCFIDANHRNPWPALDLLSLARFVKPGGTIALHDIAMKANSRGRPTLGASWIFEQWPGAKWVEPDTPNLGFLTCQPELVCKAVAGALSRNWDTWLSPFVTHRFVEIARSYPGKDAEDVVAILKARAGWAGWLA